MDNKKRQLKGILENISDYHTTIYEKTIGSNHTYKTGTVSSLELHVQGEVNHIKFNTYVGREMIGKEVTYREEITENKGKDAEFKMVIQELIPEDKTLPTYRVIENTGFV